MPFTKGLWPLWKCTLLKRPRFPNVSINLYLAEKTLHQKTNQEIRKCVVHSDVFTNDVMTERTFFLTRCLKLWIDIYEHTGRSFTNSGSWTHFLVKNLKNHVVCRILRRERFVIKNIKCFHLLFARKHFFCTNFSIEWTHFNEQFGITGKLGRYVCASVRWSDNHYLQTT